MAPDPLEQLRLASERRRRERSERGERWREDTMELPAVSGARPDRARTSRLALLTVLGLIALIALAYTVDRPGPGGSLVTRTLSQLGVLGPDGPGDQPATDDERGGPGERPAQSDPTPTAPGTAATPPPAHVVPEEPEPCEPSLDRGPGAGELGPGGRRPDGTGPRGHRPRGPRPGGPGSSRWSKAGPSAATTTPGNTGGIGQAVTSAGLTVS